MEEDYETEAEVDSVEADVEDFEEDDYVETDADDGKIDWWGKDAAPDYWG